MQGAGFVGKFAARACGYPIRIVNVRCWNLTQSSAQDAAANAWHRDGMPESVLKIMVYLTAPSEEAGTTQVKLADDNLVTLAGPARAFMLFDNNLSLIHI